VGVTDAFVDKGYRGNDYKGSPTIHISGSSSRRLTRTQKKRRKRRSAVEPKIGHLKTDNRMGRCSLRGRRDQRRPGCRRIKLTEAAARYCARPVFLALESCYRLPNGSIWPVRLRRHGVLTLVRERLLCRPARRRDTGRVFRPRQKSAVVRTSGNADCSLLSNESTAALCVTVTSYSGPSAAPHSKQNLLVSICSRDHHEYSLTMDLLDIAELANPLLQPERQSRLVVEVQWPTDDCCDFLIQG
jgi:hypothetical protein